MSALCEEGGLLKPLIAAVALMVCELLNLMVKWIVSGLLVRIAVHLIAWTLRYSALSMCSMQCSMA